MGENKISFPTSPHTQKPEMDDRCESQKLRLSQENTTTTTMRG